MLILCAKFRVVFNGKRFSSTIQRSIYKRFKIQLTKSVYLSTTSLKISKEKVFRIYNGSDKPEVAVQCAMHRIDILCNSRQQIAAVGRYTVEAIYRYIISVDVEEIYKG